VAHGDHGGGVAAVALTEEVGLRDVEMLQERDDVLGILLDRERAIRNIVGATMTLEVDRDDRMALDQCWK
jgi:hypothetical protein